MWFCTYGLGLNVHVVPDPSHGASNDWVLSVKEVGLWGLVLLLTAVYNTPYGPWNGSAFWEKLKQGLKEYLVRAEGPHDPL